MKEKVNLKKTWVIRKYNKGEDSPYDISKFEENVLLNDGLTALLELIGGIGANTPWDNANAHLGVGNGDDATSPTQTGLQGGSTDFQGMESGYPQVNNQTITWRAVFGEDDANFAWNEFTVVNDSNDSGTNLNRQTSNQGTKAQGQTWTLDLEISAS